MKKREKRSATLYAYVKQSNKDYAESYAAKLNVSVSEFIDHLIGEHKKPNASNKGKRK